jgi:ATP-dependent Lon protease
MHIARKFLLPKQLQANGLYPEHLTLTEPALLHIATQYTREAGVRGLERAIGAVVRFKAVEWAEHLDAMDDKKDGVVTTTTTKEYNGVVEVYELEKILGIARWDIEERDQEARKGVVYGLVVMGQGEGGILPVETMAVPGTGQLKLTGSLGEVRFRFSLFLLVDEGGLGYQRKWGACFDLGQDPCLRFVYHKRACSGPTQDP